jgi:hypothetical protein
MGKIKEILCLHHSHFDFGYTHPQPLLLELQKDYIDEAIDLCLKTADFPEESQFRWTIEATYPLLKWLETASEEKISIFKELVKKGQISITAMMMHTTPLANAEQLTRLLYPIRTLREKFNIKIDTAINHDINGQPWPISQILLDAGIKFYITGINIHFGGIPFKRPSIFRWQTPDHRYLLTYLGEHYSLFSQFFHTFKESTSLMDKGIYEYVKRLEDQGYDKDYVYLTATNPPLFDNNCPDPNLPLLIKKYNEEGHDIKVSFVTPEMLYKRVLRDMHLEDLPVYSGDWTDYWNFGSGSSAKETRLNRKTKQVFKKAELLESIQGSPGLRYDKVKDEVFIQSSLYDEHTWGAANSITEPDHPEVFTQRSHKSNLALKASDLSAYLLGKQMEILAENPLQSNEPEGIILVNTSNTPRNAEINIPVEYFEKGRHLAAARIKQYLPYAKETSRTKYYGTINLKPYSWRKIPFNKLATVKDESIKDNHFIVTENSIETPFYLLTFDKKTGRILDLLDKSRNWHMLDKDSNWTFFEFVKETIDPLKNIEHRSTFFPRDIDLGNRSISVWNHNWKGKRSGAEEVLSWEVRRQNDSVSYILHTKAAGLKSLTQEIRFSGLHPKIELSATINLEDNRNPESIYFVFPLNIEEGWRSHYDTAGMFVELDEEQMGNVCRDWVTVDQTISIYDNHKGVTLACPDAPLVQIGDFNFGKESKAIGRKEKPLLLAWPMNNYWDTNFWISQPGVTHFKYVLSPFDTFDRKEAYKLGVEASQEVEMNMVIHCKEEESGQFFSYNQSNIVPLHIKPAEDKQGIIILLKNLSKEPDEFEFFVPKRKIASCHFVNTLEENIEDIALIEDKIILKIPGESLSQIRVVIE